jgi:GntR family transcriptional regulator
VHVYVQLADHIAARIASGDLRPGARLPAERDLAADYGVSADTVRRAVAVLRERALVVTLTGRGSYVAERG